jgi:hypothetical protein
LTANTNVLTACIDDATGEHVFTGNVQSTISSEPVTIEAGKNRPFEISTIPITEPVPGSESQCPDPENQGVILNFVQYLDIVLTITAKNGRSTIVYDQFEDNPQ